MTASQVIGHIPAILNENECRPIHGANFMYSIRSFARHSSACFPSTLVDLCLVLLGPVVPGTP